MYKIKIHLITGKDVSFVGEYLRDLEKDNWHYYKTNTNKLIHFRKEHIVFVSEEEA